MLKWKAVAHLCSLRKVRGEAKAADEDKQADDQSAEEQVQKTVAERLKEDRELSTTFTRSVSKQKETLAKMKEAELRWSKNNQKGTAVIRINGGQVSGGFEAQWSPPFWSAFKNDNERTLPLVEDTNEDVKGKIVLSKMKEVGSSILAARKAEVAGAAAMIIVADKNHRWVRNCFVEDDDVM